MSELLGLGHKQ